MVLGTTPNTLDLNAIELDVGLERERLVVVDLDCQIVGAGSYCEQVGRHGDGHLIV